MATEPQIRNFNDKKNASITAGEWKVGEEWLAATDPRYKKFKELDESNNVSTTFAKTEARANKNVGG